MMTACDAFMRDMQPFLVADAVGRLLPRPPRAALTWAARRCGVVTSTDRVLDALGRGPDAVAATGAEREAPA